MDNDKVQKESVMNKKNFWVLGAGRFGQIAVNRISRFLPEVRLTVVDKKPPSGTIGKVQVVREEGVHWLGATLNEASSVDMIVPAIPVHVAYEWIVCKVRDASAVEPIEIPKAWQQQMPHPISGKDGQVFVSHADFVCPDNCPEPKDRCTVTGMPRPKDLFRLLDDLDLDDALSIVVRSYQILPGVGGIYPKDLMKAYHSVLENVHRPLFIATACRCHGVGNAVVIKKIPD